MMAGVPTPTAGTAMFVRIALCHTHGSRATATRQPCSTRIVRDSRGDHTIGEPHNNLLGTLGQ